MRAQTSLIAAVLYFFTLTGVKSANDSLSLNRASPLRKPLIFSVFGNEDSLVHMSVRNNFVGSGSIYNNNNLLPLHTDFYHNLEQAANRTSLTRRLYDLMIKDPTGDYSPSDNPHRAESLFTDFRGKKIQNIDFRTVSLFAPALDDYTYVTSVKSDQPGKLLNFRTREIVIRNNLLFSQGDTLDPFLIADNERILRQLSYIEDARIYVYENVIDPEYVDIVIFTKDRLSFGFDLEMSEIDRGGVEFYNKSVLGFGHEFSANILADAAESNPLGFKTGFGIKNIGGTFITTGIDYRDAFGNRVFTINSGRRFITPAMKYAGGFNFTTSRLRGEYIFHDSTFLDQPLDFNVYDTWFGRSFVLHGDEDRRNLYITARYSRSVYYERPDIYENLRYDFHNRDIFLLSLGYTSQEYRKSSYIYGFGPTEDIPLGSRFQTIAGFERSQFYPRWYTGLDLSLSNYYERVAYFRNRVALGGFVNDGSYEQGVLTAESSGFSTLFVVKDFYLRQFFSVIYTKGFARFGDEYISLSNRDGIRGLRSDHLKGTQKLAIQTETMIYSPRNWYGFRYAIYTMADLGWIGPGNGRIIGENFYSGFGLGVRVRNEHLVLPTINLRLAWFPRVPDTASAHIFYITSERSRLFDEFNITAPEILPFR